jgi:predicted  nucleic acid-binding Zn-ribbon protein
VSTIMEKILVIQDRDRRIRELSRECDDIPVHQKQIESRLDAHRGALKATQEELKKQAAASKEIDVEIESMKQKINKFREQQLQIKSNVEYKALENEIATTQAKIRELEDKELTVMEAMEQVRGTLAGREKDLQQDQNRVNEEMGTLGQRRQHMQSEIEALKKERAILAADVSPDWLSKYERIFQKTGDFAVVPVEHGTCGGCHMTLPPSVVHNAKNPLLITACNFCGRMLYWQP